MLTRTLKAARLESRMNQKELARGDYPAGLSSRHHSLSLSLSLSIAESVPSLPHLSPGSTLVENRLAEEGRSEGRRRE